MFSTLPRDLQVFINWKWEQLKPFADDLLKRPLNETTQDDWLMDWSDLNRVISEMYARLVKATSLDTADEEAKTRYNQFLDGVYSQSRAANQELKKKLLASGLQPAGFDIPMRNMRVEAEIYRDKNVPLLVEEAKLSSEYDEIIGAQTVEWEGQEMTITQLQPVLLSSDRSKREQVWRLGMQRILSDRQKLNDLWAKLVSLRTEIAANSGFEDYRSYCWKALQRFDYSPDDCKQFQKSIEEVVVPAAERIYEQRRKALGVESLRPWDLDVDPYGRKPLKPYQDTVELEDKASAIFHRVDPELGKYFEIIRSTGQLDLDNYKGKAPGAYSMEFSMSRLPFIFENAVGIHADVTTLLHESGHSFHVFERAHLPYYQQSRVGMEFAEVASMAMEFLASPYLAASMGGFYSEKDAARARIDHLNESVLFWPYMAVVDGFQHWVYENPTEAVRADQCDRKWSELWRRFMLGVDWSGMEDFMATGWQRKEHIFGSPFYYVEYGMALLGAFQVFANARKDQKTAVAAYRRALALGGTVTLPELYAAAGTKFAFDKVMLNKVVSLAEQVVRELELV